MNYDTSRAQVAVAAHGSETCARLTAALRLDPALNIVGEARDEAGLLALGGCRPPDILLLDAALACGINGTLTSWTSTRIILLVDAVDSSQVVQAIRLAARGIVAKTSSPRVLLESIRTVIAHGYCLDVDSITLLLAVARRLLVAPSEHCQNEKYKLTTRELGVVAMIAHGCSNKQISRELSISERTVKHHLTSVFSKLGVSTRLQLANLAVTRGLIADVDSSVRLLPLPACPKRSEGARLAGCTTRIT